MMAEMNPSGQLPWMPASTPLAERERWQRGWQFEAAMFDDLALLPPTSIDVSYQECRRTVLQHFYYATEQRPDLATLEQQALAVDHLLLAPSILPDHLDREVVLHHIFVNRDHLILGSLLQGETTTPSTWFDLFRGQVPEDLQHHLISAEDIFVAVALDGRLADQRPSVVAAAVLAYLLEEQAEDYLCGYDLFEIGGALTLVETILRSLAPMF